MHDAVDVIVDHEPLPLAVNVLGHMVVDQRDLVLVEGRRQPLRPDQRSINQLLLPVPVDIGPGHVVGSCQLVDLVDLPRLPRIPLVLD